MKEQHLYRFGQFGLRTDDYSLRRNDKVIPVTPKMTELLLVLLENQGRILDKEFLLENVWPDSFVEEGNISFNIRQLRKALDDNAQSPTYIETIPRRGYRFIAKVEKVLPASDPLPDLSSEAAEQRSVHPGSASPPKHRYSLLMATILFLSAAAVGSFYLLNEKIDAAPVLSAPFASEKLSTTGNVFGAAISPDGKTVVFSVRTGETQSVWLRQLGSGTNVEMIPPSEEDYYEFTYSPDGEWIYFSRGKHDLEGTIEIFRISVFGGIPEKVLTGTNGSVSISPDGKTISYVRCPRRDEEWCSLYTADAATGKNERRLVSYPYPIRIADNEISPDGTRIAYAFGQSRNQANAFSVAEFDLLTATERVVTTERFFNVKNICWLPDGSGLLLTASRIPNKHFRIWHLSSDTGTAEPLTNDSEAYSVLSLDKEAKKLISTQIKQDFRIHVFSLDDPSQKRFLADASRATYASDGKIYFSSVMSGNDEIWSIDPDGSGRRQITTDPGGDGAPVVSPDNKTVFFTSNRSGSAHVWKMNADGTDQTQVTSKEGGSPIFVAPDGRIVYYRHGIDGTLWSVTLENGKEKMEYDRTKERIAISPDGLTMAFEKRIDSKLFVALVSMATKETVGTFELPSESSRLLELSWMPDGRSVLFMMSNVNYKGNVVYQYSFESKATRRIADLGDDEVSEVSGIAVSPDGKNFAVVQGGWKHDAVLIKGLR